MLGILLQVQGRILAVKVPVINALILIKNRFLGKGERNIIVHIAKLCLFAVGAAQERFIEVRFCFCCTFQQRFTCCVTGGCCIRNQALIGIIIACTLSFFIDCGVIDCHEAIFIFEVVIKPPKIQCSTNRIKPKSPVRIRRLEMSGIKRVLGLCILIIIAQRLIKFTEGYPVAVTYSRRTLIVTTTVLAVQLVICIIVIQRTGNIFCVCFFRKISGFNIYYCSFFPRFGITRGTFWSPVAATLALAIYCIVIRIRIEAPFRHLIVCRYGFPACTVAAVCKVLIVTQRIRREYDFGIAIRHICCIVICALNPAHCAAYAFFAISF